MMTSSSRPVRWCFWFPIIFFEIYLDGTVILFTQGPWPWPATDPVEPYGYLFVAHLLLLGGYALGVVKKKLPLDVTEDEVSRTVGWALALSVILLIPTSF